MSSDLIPIYGISGKISIDSEFSITGTVQPFQNREYYDGVYEVNTSLTDDIVLNTKDKVMRDDVTINKYGLTVTSNSSGGYTLYIGQET